MKRCLIVAVMFCVLMVNSAHLQSPTIQDPERGLESILIAPTDWESLRSVEMVEDDCDFEEKTESCERGSPKPKTTLEARGIVVSDACNKPAKVLAAYKPCYSPLAKLAKVAGPVHVIVVVDEAGFVVWANASRANPLLQPAALKAACKWRFEPAGCNDGIQKVNRLISFYFQGVR